MKKLGEKLLTKKATMTEKCSHSKTKIWEPHLAGARKCLACDWVYNPNHEPAWFDEDKEEEDAEKAEYERLKKKFEKRR